MGNVQYRSTVWICRHLSQDIDIPQDSCTPLVLFPFVMHQQTSWGRYAAYITWLDRQFPSQGCMMFRCLKRDYLTWMYSFPYLVGQYLLYHVFKTINNLCRPLRTRIVRRCECICQSTQDTLKESETTTGTAS